MKLKAVPRGSVLEEDILVSTSRGASSYSRIIWLSPHVPDTFIVKSSHHLDHAARTALAPNFGSTTWVRSVKLHLSVARSLQTLTGEIFAFYQAFRQDPFEEFNYKRTHSNMPGYSSKIFYGHLCDKPPCIATSEHQMSDDGGLARGHHEGRRENVGAQK